MSTDHPTDEDKSDGQSSGRQDAQSPGQQDEQSPIGDIGPGTTQGPIDRVGDDDVEEPLEPLTELGPDATDEEFYEAIVESFKRKAGSDTLAEGLCAMGVQFDEAVGGGAVCWVGAGNAGSRFVNTDLVTSYRADTTHASPDVRGGVSFKANARFTPRYAVLDTTMIRDSMQKAIPKHAGRLGEAYLSNFYPLDPNAPDGRIQGVEGVGGDSRRLAKKMVEDPNAIPWFVDRLTTGGFTVQLLVAGLGGGTGGGQLTLGSELARREILGTESDFLVYKYTTPRMGRTTVARPIPGGDDITTFDEQVSQLQRVGRDLQNPDISNCAIHMENDCLAVHEFLSEEHCTRNRTESYLSDVRDGTIVNLASDLEYDADLREYRTHSDMNRAARDCTFFINQALLDPAKVKFSAGNELWDQQEIQHDLGGLAWSPAVVGVEEYEEVSARNPNTINEIHCLDDLIYGLTRLAVPKLASSVTYEEIERALAFIYLPYQDVSIENLAQIEDEIGHAYGLNSARDDTVRAINISGLEPEEIPGDDDVARLQILAGHQVPPESFETRSSEEFRNEVTRE